MSTIKKGFKKLYRGVKKVIKKIPKPVLIIGATLLTAGLATPGVFAGIGSSMASATGVMAKTGAFFKGVGTALATGASTIGSALGFGGAAGATGPMAGLGPLSNSAYATATGVSSTSLAGLGGGAANLWAAGGTALKSSGFMGTVMGALGNMTKGTVGQMMLAQGIMGGIQSYQQAREVERQEKRFDQEYVWGTQRRGGTGENVMETPDIPRLAAGGGVPTPQDWRARTQSNMAVEQPANPAPENLAFRRPLLDRPERQVPGMIQEDDDWFNYTTAPQPLLA